MKLIGKSFVITGGESGIGRAIALAAADAGADIAVCGLDRAGLDATVNDVKARGRRALGEVIDIRAADAIAAFLSEARSAFGIIDGVIANAGIIGRRASVTDLTSDDWRHTLDVNLLGTVNTLMAGARLLLEQGKGGSLIATGSSTALRPIPGLLPYAVSKGAIHTLIHGLAVELAPQRIRVNLLVPGTTATDATRAMPGYLENVGKTLPLGSVVEVEELAALVVFALSDAAPHMTGTHLKIDSGRTL